MQAVEQVMPETGANIIGCRPQRVSPRCLSGDFKESSSLAMGDDLYPQQVVFANSFEHEFYVVLTTSKHDYRFYT